MTRRYASPLTKILQVLQRELTRQTELGIQHRSHVTRIQEETVTSLPTRVLRIVLEKLAKEDVDEVCATHRSARVTTLCLLYCRCSQDTDVIRCTIQKLCLVHDSYIFCLVIFFFGIPISRYTGISPLKLPP